MNIIHFVYLTNGPGGKEFGFTHYMAMRSALEVNPGFRVFVHLQHEPEGPYWELIRPHVELVHVTAPDEIFGNPITHFAHKADVIRLQALIRYGGIYLDMDTICQRSFAPIMGSKVVLGIESATPGLAQWDSNRSLGLCNATMIAPPEAEFLKIWLNEYRSFDGGKWNQHSVHRPAQLARQMPELVRIEPPESFFWPIFVGDGLKSLFEDDGAFPHAYSIHLWETKSWPYISKLNYERVMAEDTAYNRIARRFVEADREQLIRISASGLGDGLRDARRRDAAGAEAGPAAECRGDGAVGEGGAATGFSVHAPHGLFAHHATTATAGADVGGIDGGCAGMRIACVNMQRNEDHCLEPWLKYHGYLFGFENLFILDHNSTSPKTLACLEKFESCGVSVRRLPADANYQKKGKFVAEEIRRIEALADFDFVFPIDCDEFLFVRDEEGVPVCSRVAIEAHLAGFRAFEGILEIKENFLHILGHAGYFWSQPYQKVFFAGGQCVSLDHGSHVGVARGGERKALTRFAYAHFHFKPYEIDREMSREKLRPWVDVDDPEAVRAFAGPGAHLRRHLLATREDYYAGFRLDKKAIYFDGLVKLFRMLDIDPDFSAIDVDGQAYRPADGPGSEGRSRPAGPHLVPASVGSGGSDGRPDRLSPVSASQSSNSAWSFRRNPSNDALGGIDGKPDGSFGFHTDIEDAPWWMADLGAICGVSEIRLFNRLDNPGIAARAAWLAIEVGFDADRLIEVYRRESEEPFGGVDGNPLVFTPTIPIPGRFVRIRLLTRNYLHLDQVEVYGEALPGLAGEAGAN